MEENNWITSILNSSQGMTQVTPDDQLFAKIKNQIRGEQPISTSGKWLIAASIAALIAINVTFFIKDSKKETNEQLTELLHVRSNQLY